MANWHGTSRTNYVYVDDIDLLKETLAPFDITIDVSNDGVMFSSRESDSGSFPSFVYVQHDDQEDKELVFDWKEHVMPYVKEGEVLIVMSVGAEKYRYVTGYSEAYVRKGTDIQSIGLDIGEIYELASEELGILPRTRAEY